MKVIKYNELGNYFKEKSERYFNKWYSDNTDDYIEDIQEEYNEKEDIYNCHIELTNKGQAPLIIEFYKRYIYDEFDNITDVEYFID